MSLDPSIHALTWFEIAVEDLERARRFYGSMLEADFPVSERDGVKMAFFPADHRAGGIGGALKAGDGIKPGADGTLVYLHCPDGVGTVLERVQPAGGRILQGRTELPGIGFIGVIEDPDGNRVGLHSRE